MMTVMILDSDKEFHKTLEKMITQILPHANYESFSSVSACYDYLKKQNVTIVLLSKEIGQGILDYQMIVSKIKAIQPHINIILISKNPLDTMSAFWNMENHITDDIQKPVTLEKLKNAFQLIADLNF